MAWHGAPILFRKYDTKYRTHKTQNTKRYTSVVWRDPYAKKKKNEYCCNYDEYGILRKCANQPANQPTNQPIQNEKPEKPLSTKHEAIKQPKQHRKTRREKWKKGKTRRKKMEKWKIGREKWKIGKEKRKKKKNGEQHPTKPGAEERPGETMTK